MVQVLFYFVPAAITAGAWYGATWPFRLVPAIFIGVTVVDGFFPATRRADATGAPRGWTGGSLSRLAVRLWLPAQIAIVMSGLVSVTGHAVGWPQWWSITMAVGMTGGIFSVPVAHELMHGHRLLERVLAEALLLLMSYPHFCIEHLSGHHARVATPEDPSTAPLGQSLYAFLPRAIVRGWMSAWSSESDRLRRRGVPVVSLRNRVLRGALETAAMYALTGAAFGVVGVAFFALQSVVAIAMLETVNYIQHYGLARTRGTDGRYEQVTRMHAWNSRHRASNWFLLNLGLHSDHHCDSTKPYPSLSPAQGDLHLPTGLFGMVVLALFPPLWRQIMDPLVEASR